MNSPRPLDARTFKAPNRDFGILPFWFLNGELDPDEMRFQLRELRDKGMHGVVFHGRYGLEMPYLGDEYLDRIRLGVEEANRLGLKAWIYDEMNWPSGTADKRVLRARPDLAQRYLECVSFQIRGPWFMCLTGEDSRYLDFQRSEPVAAFAIGEHGEVVDLTPNLSFDKVVPWEVPPGLWQLSYIVEKRADYYIDAMDPESTAEFLRQGYAPYLDALGNGRRDADGRAVTGFYSDEPSMHYFLTAADNAIVPWTKNMFRRFEERNGYDLRSRLMDLFQDLNPDAARTRYDFYSTTTALYTDAYYTQIHEWCREQGVLFTAHLLFEEWLRQMIRVEGNLFSHYAQMDVVAVDHLYPVIGTREAPDQHVAMKVASSAAHHFGSTRLICESFGGIFMDATMQRMKWIADWEYVLGVNLLNPHGFHYTFEGPRKRDWPPSMFYQTPWWGSYGEFSEYMSRTSEVLSGGRHVAKVAVLWPINAAFATYLPQRRTPENSLVEAGLNVLTDTLLRLHHDFDYLDEDVLAGCDVEHGLVRIADEEYELVIVPPMGHVKLRTVETLERFVAGGGTVLGVIETPQTGLGPEGLSEVGERVRALMTAVVEEDPSVVTNPPGPERDRFASALGAAIRGLVEPAIQIDNEEIFTLHRRRDDHDVQFLVNTTDVRQAGTVSLAGLVSPELWDPTSGERTPPGPVVWAEGRTSFEISLPPVGSTFVVTAEDGAARPRVIETNLVLDEVAPGRVRGYADGPTGWAEVEVAGQTVRLSVEREAAPAARALEGPWRFTAEDDGALVVRGWRATPEVEGTTVSSYAASDAEEDGWLPVIAGAWALQLSAEPGPWPIPVWYRIPFTVEDLPERLALLVDGFGGDDPRVFLNGHEISAAPVRSDIDSQMKRLDLVEWATRGENVLAVRLVLTGPTGGLVDHVKLVGSFSVRSQGDVERIVTPVREVRPASWTDQGYPYYSGRGLYATDIEIDEASIRPDLRWFLDVPMRDDVVELSVNGRAVGTRMWEPYVFDVTDEVRAGVSSVELRVSNTPANLLNGVARPSGLAGTPVLRPAVFFELDIDGA